MHLHPSRTACAIAALPRGTGSPSQTEHQNFRKPCKTASDRDLCDSEPGRAASASELARADSRSESWGLLGPGEDIHGSPGPSVADSPEGNRSMHHSFSTNVTKRTLTFKSQ